MCVSLLHYTVWFSKLNAILHATLPNCVWWQQLQQPIPPHPLAPAFVSLYVNWDCKRMTLNLHTAPARNSILILHISIKKRQLMSTNRKSFAFKDPQCAWMCIERNCKLTLFCGSTHSHIWSVVRGRDFIKTDYITPLRVIHMCMRYGMDPGRGYLLWRFVYWLRDLCYFSVIILASELIALDRSEFTPVICGGILCKCCLHGKLCFSLLAVILKWV